MTEVWKAIPGYSGYEISSLGNVRSLDRTVVHSNGRKQFVEGKALKLLPNHKGYLRVSLNLNGKIKQNFVHVLVSEAFIGPRVGQVNHKDHNKANNHYSNLEYVAPRENINHNKREVSKYPPGVYMKRPLGDKKFYAQYEVNKKKIGIGYFKTVEEASQAYIKTVSALGETKYSDALKQTGEKDNA